MAQVLNIDQFKEGVKLVALLQATLEQMDVMKNTPLHKQSIKNLMRNLEQKIERALKGPLNALDNEDPDLLTKIQLNIELVLGLSLDELAMLRIEIDRHRNEKRGD